MADPMQSHTDYHGMWSQAVQERDAARKELGKARAILREQETTLTGDQIHCRNDKLHEHYDGCLHCAYEGALDRLEHLFHAQVASNPAVWQKAQTEAMEFLDGHGRLPKKPQPAEYGRSASMDKRLKAQGKEPHP